MFMVRSAKRWRFVLVRRDKLAELRDAFEQADRSGKRGRPPTADDSAKTDALALRIDWSDTEVVGWGQSLAPYVDRWPDTFPENMAGPGAVRGSGS